MDGADWLRTQLTSFGCAACGQGYDAGRIRVLAERDGLFFVDLACSHCGSQAVAIVTIQLDENEAREVDAGELADVIAAEPVAAGPPAPPVSSDDVLEMRAFLKDFDGDLSQLVAAFEGTQPAERE